MTIGKETLRELYWKAAKSVIVAFSIVGVVLAYQNIRNQDRKEEESVPSRHQIMFPDHVGYSKLTDIDRDGKWDVLEQRVCGPNGFNRLTYKNGYGPAQSVDAEIKIESPTFFEQYDKCFPIKK